jgi:hypothetical protein
MATEPASSLATLAQEMRTAIQRRAANRDAWIDETFNLGRKLKQARDALSNQDFGEWLAKNGIELNKNDRPALIHLAEHEQEARKYFERKPESWSPQHAWDAIREEVSSSGEDNGKKSLPPIRRRGPNPPRVTAATIRANEQRLAEDMARQEQEARRKATEKAFAAQGTPADPAGPVIDVEPTSAGKPAGYSAPSADPDPIPATRSPPIRHRHPPYRPFA